MNPLQKIYEISIKFLGGIRDLWDWLNTELHIGFDVPILGYIGIDGFVPIEIIGGVLVTVILLWVIKALLPVA